MLSGGYFFLFMNLGNTSVVELVSASLLYYRRLWPCLFYVFA